MYIQPSPVRPFAPTSFIYTFRKSLLTKMWNTQLAKQGRTLRTVKQRLDTRKPNKAQHQLAQWAQHSGTKSITRQSGKAELRNCCAIVYHVYINPCQGPHGAWEEVWISSSNLSIQNNFNLRHFLSLTASMNHFAFLHLSLTLAINNH
jgi:hypothetical protein